jgi:hypothetical protein
MTTKETKLRLPLELHGWLMLQAESQGISLTKYIIQVLEDHKNIPTTIPTSTPTDFEKRLATLESRLEKLESDNKSNTWQPTTETHTTHSEVISPVEEVNIAQNPEPEPNTDASSLIVDAAQEPEQLLQESEAIAEVIEPTTSGDNNIPNLGDTEGLTLTTEELLERFKRVIKNKGTINTVRSNLSKVKMKKLREENWTAQHDPDGLTWIPTDEKARDFWIVFKPSPQVSPDLSPVV